MKMSLKLANCPIHSSRPRPQYTSKTIEATMIDFHCPPSAAKIPNPNFSKPEFGTTDLDFWNYNSPISLEQTNCSNLLIT
jgi:hypothetical protein